MDIQNKKQWGHRFLEACRQGKLEDVRHLCQKKYLTLGWSNIHIENEEGLHLASENNHLSVVKYLLTSMELMEEGHTFSDLHCQNEIVFRESCYYGHFEIVKFLLSSEIKEAGHKGVNVHAGHESGFRWACKNEHWNVIRWLIMDYGIEKTNEIEALSLKYPQAQEYFDVREEFKEIQEALWNPKENSSKNRALHAFTNEGRVSKAKKL